MSSKVAVTLHDATKLEARVLDEKPRAAKAEHVEHHKEQIHDSPAKL